MKKINFIFVGLFFCFSIFAKSVDFPVSGLLTISPEPVPVTAEWEDSWFTEKSSFEYNHGIARVASIFSEISYVDVLNNPDDNELKRTYKMLGVKDSNMEFFYDLDYSLPVYGINQTAFSIASKKIETPEGKKTLVFIVIRGTPLGASEWVSNLEVKNGDAKVHEGFAKCTEQVHNRLIYYLLKNKITPEDTIFFITGHSRGGAVSNLLGAKLYDEGIFKNENIFIYTFACPNVIEENSGKNLEDKYGFIWNIVNPEDAVPSLPPCRGDWHFYKYGHILTLTNRWYVPTDLFDDDYEPRMNQYFSKLLGREYCPFDSGTFIQSQFSRLVTGMYKTIDDYYTGFLNLPETSKNMMKDIFSKGKIDPSNLQNQNKFLTFIIDSLTNGSSDYTMKAFSDMHACETYLSWVMALNENECYSKTGSTQLILDGYYECAIYDKNGERVGRILDGVLQLESIKTPIAVTPLLGKSVAIGFPVNENFSVVVYKESLIPSIVSAQVEHYNEFGRLVSTSEKQNMYPHMGVGMTFKAGELWASDDKISANKISGQSLKQEIENGELMQQEKVFIEPEIFYDLDNQLGLGVHIGTANVYGSFFTVQHLNSFGSTLEFTPGVGHQNALFANILLDSEFFTRFVFVLKDVPNNGFNFVPALRFTLSFKPWNRIEFFASGVFDFNFRNFNDGAFNPEIRKNVLGNIELGNVARIYPTLAFGLRCNFAKQ